MTTTAVALPLWFTTFIREERLFLRYEGMTSTSSLQTDGDISSETSSMRKAFSPSHPGASAYNREYVGFFGFTYAGSVIASRSRTTTTISFLPALTTPVTSAISGACSPRTLPTFRPFTYAVASSLTLAMTSRQELPARSAGRSKLRRTYAPRGRGMISAVGT